ncbi:epimerase [Frankia sp. R43]|uniref:NAD-dependent epimerase/dehydratase family protein n=1 Tax=Frankia sp. R43 TaxID=269536 RepID=UPI0006CA53FF|nr:NAD(P)-dependent oxidoreductase [Frankia sp. R43]KPM54929.1 epimerase [Frankia sp. R43]
MPAGRPSATTGSPAAGLAPTAVQAGPRRRDSPSTVLLTGGTGRVGRWVRAVLQDRDLMLLGRSDPHAAAWERWMPVDLAAGQLELSAPTGAVLCHLAYDNTDPSRNPDMALDLVAAVNACPDITRVVVASTISVYGTGHRGVIDEATRCQPRSAYGRAKLASEQPWLRVLRPDCELAVLRLGAVVAAGHPASYALVTDTLRRPLRAALLGSVRRGTGVYYVAAQTAAAAIRFALDSPLPSRRAVFNVVDDELASNTDYAAMQDVVRSLAGQPAQARISLPDAIVAAADRLTGGPRNTAPISSAAFRSAGFVNPAPLRDELARIVGTIIGTPPTQNGHAAPAGGSLGKRVHQRAR